MSAVATVPFYESTRGFGEKIDQFFFAVEEFNKSLEWDTRIDTLAFAIMVPLL